MIELLIILITNSLFIWGLNACFEEGMILYFLDRWINRIKEIDELKGILSRRNVGVMYCAPESVGFLGALTKDMKREEKEEVEVDSTIAEKAQKELEALKPRIPDFLQKPLYSCPICMASIWGTIGYFIGAAILIGLSWQIIAIWPLYCFVLAGLNAVIVNLMPCCDE